MTLAPGVYCFASSAAVTGAVTLDAGGDSNAVWVFKIGSTLITASNSSVVPINGAQNCNVFWQVGSSATLGTDTTFIGNILALTSITLTTGATVSGRALAQNGAVTMDDNAIAVCAVPTTGTPIPPTLSKAFSPATIKAGGSSTLTITLSNPDSAAASLSAPLIDNLPSGLVVSGTPSTTCGGTATASNSAVTLTGGSIPANGSCTLTVPVTAASGGNYINSLAVGTLQTSNGNNAAPAVATLTVPQPATAPTLGKAFGPATINAGGGSTLTITLSNSDSVAASLTAPLVDNLPSGLIAGTPSTTCPGGIATASNSAVTLTGGSIPANGSCTVTVPVTAASGGNYINSLAAGALQTSNGSNAAPAIATLTVNTPASVAPTLGKTFSPATIKAGGASSLVITLSNTDGAAANLTAPLVDNLPSGLIAGTPSTTCPGSIATASNSTVTLTGGSIPANGSCTVTVPVTAPNGGSYINSLAAGALQTSNGSNAAPAIATLTVSQPSPVTLGKAFGPASISAAGYSTLTITLSNTNGTAANLTVPLVDNLPSGVLVAGKASTTCGGTATASNSTVTLTGGSIPANGSCTVTVTVTAPLAGSYFNSLAAGALQTNLGNNAAPAVATLTVLPAITPPTLSKSFCPATISVGEISTLTITLINSNGTVAKLTAPLTDYLPSGVVVAGSASTTCGGTVTANKGGSKVCLTGGSIPANGSCTVTVSVTATCNGSFCNTLPACALQTNLGNNAAPASATLTVRHVNIPPTLAKDFRPASIHPGGISILTITLSNNNDTAASLSAPLTDDLPRGVVVAGKATTTCGGKVSASTSKVSLMGCSIPAKGYCKVTVPVTTTCDGSFCNILPAGALQTDQGNNTAPASATLTANRW
jgi:hypothetical protein